MIVFRPGPFDTAPHTLHRRRARRAGARPRARACRACSSPAIRTSRSSIFARCSTRSQSIVNNVTLAVTVVGGLVLFSGSLILIGAVSMTKFRRVYEAAILKTLGASSRLIATMLLVEYGVLGAIAGTVGALGAIVLSWAVARYALDLPWEPAPLPHDWRHRRHGDLRRRRRRHRQPRRAPPQAARDAPRRVARVTNCTCLLLWPPEMPARRAPANGHGDLPGRADAGSAASCWAELRRSRCSGRWRTTPVVRATWPIRPPATTKSTFS